MTRTADADSNACNVAGVSCNVSDADADTDVCNVARVSFNVADVSSNVASVL